MSKVKWSMPFPSLSVNNSQPPIESRLIRPVPSGIIIEEQLFRRSFRRIPGSGILDQKMVE